MMESWKWESESLKYRIGIEGNVALFPGSGVLPFRAPLPSPPPSVIAWRETWVTGFNE